MNPLPPRKTLIKNPKTILVRAPNWIGDQVLAFPFFYQLRQAFPQARIVVACVPWVESIQFKSLVNEVHVLKVAAGSSFFAKFKQLNAHAAQIKNKVGKIDWGISLPNSLSSAWLLKRSGAELRTGYKFDGRGFLLNDGLELPDDRAGILHRAQAYLNLLPDLMRGSTPATEFFGSYPANELDDKIPGILKTFEENRFWPGERMAVPEGPYWVLAPGATADSRRWP
ncbi:MAG: hypothetical protein EOP09_04700, partial [Proteobacteria bacterium]